MEKTFIRDFISSTRWSFVIPFIFFINPVFSTIKIESKEGLKISDEENEQYYCKLNVHFKVDHTFFVANSQNKSNLFPNGALVRAAEFGFSGGLGRNFSYILKLDFSRGNPQMEDAYLKYKGFGKNINLAMGYVPVPFSFENACSSKWTSFLEKPLPILAFVPYYGFGLYVNANFANCLTITSTLAYPQELPMQFLPKRNNPLSEAFRVTYSPVHRLDTVLHLGFSFRQQKIHSMYPIFRTRPEARARNTPSLIGLDALRTKRYAVLAMDGAFVLGPLSVQGEYSEVRINQILASLRCYGWYAQGSYVLTGESREYNFATGTFGRVRPKSNFGAFEVAFRYSYLNMNDKGIMGGLSHNNGMSIGWYANDQLKIMSNYIRSNIKTQEGEKHTLHIIGTRLQMVY